MIIRRLFLSFALLGIFALYLWTASAREPAFSFERHKTDYYNMLTDGLLKGQTSLLVLPAKELLALPTPYDPVANWRWRIHDMSFYHGKYYLYFGIGPALAIFLPFRALSGVAIPESLACTLFWFFGTLLWIFLAWFLQQTFLPFDVWWKKWPPLLLFGLGGLTLYTLRRVAVYETAIGGSYFFQAASMYCLATGLFGKRTSLARLALASLCWGMAVACRPPAVCAFPAFLAAILYIYKQGYRGSEWKLSSIKRELLCLSVPAFLCAVGLLLYNYVRFDDPLEFGQRYQLAALDVSKLDRFAWRYIPFNISCYLFRSPLLDKVYPYFHVRTCSAPYPSGYLGIEATAGIFWAAPFLLWLFLMPFFVFCRNRLNWEQALFYLGTVALANAAALCFMLFAFCGSTTRYQPEFIPYFILAAWGVWTCVDVRLRAKRMLQIAVNSLTVLSILLGSIFSLAVSLTGYFDWLRVYQPAQYQHIQRWFTF